MARTSSGARRRSSRQHRVGHRRCSTATTSCGAPPGGENIVWGTASGAARTSCGAPCATPRTSCGARLRRRRLREHRVGHGHARCRQHRLGHGARRREHRVGHVPDGENIVWGTSDDDAGSGALQRPRHVDDSGSWRFARSAPDIGTACSAAAVGSRHRDGHAGRSAGRGSNHGKDALPRRAIGGGRAGGDRRRAAEPRRRHRTGGRRCRC